MKTKTLALALTALLAIMLAPAQAQDKALNVAFGADAPSGACSTGRSYIRTSNFHFYVCSKDGAWHDVADTVAVPDLSVLPDPTNVGTAAVNDRLILNPVVKGAGQFDGTITSADLTGTQTWSLPDSSGTFALTSDVPDLTSYEGQWFFEFSGTNNRYLTFYSNYSANPNNKWPSISLEAEDSDQNYSTLAVFGPGTVIDAWAPATVMEPSRPGTASVRSWIAGGYNVTGSPYSPSSPTPATIKVTLTDSSTPFTAGDVQVCGYATQADSDLYNKVCENLDFSSGPGNQTTTQTYYQVNTVKSSSFNNLNGGSAETIRVEWTGGNDVLYYPQDLVNSTATEITPNVYVTLTNFAEVNCLDLQGCSVSLYGNASNVGWVSGRFVTIRVLPTSNPITFASNANQKVVGDGVTLAGNDTISFILDAANSYWVETARSSASSILLNGTTQQVGTKGFDFLIGDYENAPYVNWIFGTDGYTFDAEGTDWASGVVEEASVSTNMWRASVYGGNSEAASITQRYYGTALRLEQMPQARPHRGLVENSGGYTVIDYAGPESPTTLTVTIADGSPSISDGDIQLCGDLLDSDESTDTPWSCETIDISAGVGSYVSVQSYARIRVVKASSMAGNSGGETIKVKWTGGSDQGVVATATLANSTKSKFDGTQGGSFLPSISFGNGNSLVMLKCLDLLGCDVAPIDPVVNLQATEVTYYALNGTTPITFTEGNKMKLSAATVVLDSYDTLKLVTNSVDLVWVEITHSAN